ncbi:MAG: VOC family protein [Candidatus Rokuibacteriota bacterium]
MEQRLSLVTLGVADVGRSRRFYERLGWKASAASVESTVFFQLGGMVLALWGRGALAEDAGLPDAGSAFGGIALAYNARTRAEVDAVLEAAREAGGRVLRPPADAVWGGYTGYFADPDGHPWEVAWNPHFTLRDDGGLELPGS